MKTFLFLIFIFLASLFFYLNVNSSFAAGQQVAVSATVSEQLTYFIDKKEENSYILIVSTNLSRSFSIISPDGILAKIDGPVEIKKICFKTAKIYLVSDF
ncbi:MAG: hypothetical protein Athens101428_175 [Candidatus Berkelbacteria bacterium Athens1014_28]|uniref:Uncharacterized protein n=1 Tax=Candidatus Berkelbacteria bacterium Athens1014_28 TaxID=2017145 RepID=A0A554LPL2_9BACT|nr:MAG: hypothetical protein Athens101428_175 [Candidatus Berkelbacteria bacterium Athens1014_28]